jgi:hypothetical protein
VAARGFSVGSIMDPARRMTAQRLLLFDGKGTLTTGSRVGRLKRV